MSKLEIGVIEVSEAAAEAFLHRASASGRSIQDLTAELIARSVEARPDESDWLKRIDEIAAMTPKGVRQTDSTEILREIRGE